MRKFSLVLIAVLVVLCSINGVVYAENEITNEVTEIEEFGNSAMDVALDILDQVVVVALPVCAIFLVIGAVQYFIMGIRNLYKKKQGLILMFSSMTFYVVIIVTNFVLTLLSNQDAYEIVNSLAPIMDAKGEQVSGAAMEIALGILSQATLWSLPFCAILLVYGAVQFYVMGIRNLYKKRQGLLLMFGSLAFYAIIVIINFVLSLII